MKTEIDKKSGFCFGVIEAISKAENELKKKNGCIAWAISFITGQKLTVLQNWEWSP